MARETWMWLVSGLGYGAVNTGELLEAYPDGAEAILTDLGSDKLDELLTQKQAEKLASTRPADYALMLAHAEAKGIYAVSYEDKMYPEMLRSITNPPLLLFVKGDLTLLNGQLSIGMVGARRPSGYGVEAVKTIGRGAALGGAIIVSGLAAGLDSEAHKAALAVNGPTIACIAFGHDHCYPAQNKKLMEVIERYGAVVSEYPPETKPEKPYFLHRNRLIAGLSHALVVAEARKHSGTMSTVNFATDYGRDVFAVPGSIFSELSSGTNAMIRDGAYLAATAVDILSMYGIELPEEAVEKASEKQAQEGRPLMASALPPWQQVEPREVPRRQMTRQQVIPDDISPSDVAQGEQTLLEALQGELKQNGKTDSDRVSRGAAIDAFRRLQQEMPPTADSEVDARNRALDEMVAAVNDSVSISSREQKKPKNRPERQKEMHRLIKEQEEGDVKPFRWDSVEHLSRKDLKKAEQEEAQKAAAQPGRTVRMPVASVEAVSPVGAVSAAPPVYPVSMAQPAMSVVEAAAPVPVPVQPQPDPPREEAPPAPMRAENGAPPAAPAESFQPTAAPVRAQPAEMEATAAPRVEKEKPPRREKAVKKQDGARSLVDVFRREEADLTGKLRTMQKRTEERRSALQAQGEMPRPAQPKPTPAVDAGVYKPMGGVPASAATPKPMDVVELPNNAMQTPAWEADEKPANTEKPSLRPETSFAPKPSRWEPPSFSPEPGVKAPVEVPPAPAAPSALYDFPGPELAEDEMLDTLSEAAKQAYHQLGVNPTTLAQISERSGLTSGEAMAALTELELAGLSRQLPGRQFIIMQ